MSQFIDVWVIGLAVATLTFGTPLVLAALGGMFSERSGIVNIALEGMMTAGAFFAVYVSVQAHHWIIGLLGAILAGMALAFVHAVATVTFQADQIISGTAIILIAAGLINFLNLNLFGPQGSPADFSTPPKIFDVSILVPMSIALVFVSWWVMFRTPFGLRLRSVGEHPRAADTVGIDVYRMRYIAVLISGALAGLGGAVTSYNVSSYTENMIAGNGFIALAALIFGKWKPFPVLAACMLFGFSQGLASRLPFGSPELLNSIPYVITLFAIAGFVGKSVAPAAIGKAYVKQ